MTRPLLLLLLLLLAPAAAHAQSPDGGAGSGVTVHVQVGEGGDTMFEVKRGDAIIRSNGKQEHVTTGEQVRTQLKQPLQRRTAPPQLLTPADNAIVNTLDVPFTWQPVPGASRYLLEIAPDAQFLTTRSQTVGGTSTSLKLDASSSYFWRVVALDGNGLAGRLGGARRVSVDVTPAKPRSLHQ